MNRDSTAWTLLISAAVALFCSLLVSAAVVYLRPVQMAWAELARNRLVMELAGVLPAAEPLADREVAARFRAVQVVLVDLAGGNIVSGRDPLAYDPRDEALLAGEGVDIPAESDLAGLGRRTSMAPVYLRVENGAMRRLVLPMWGQGMWAPIEAYLAIGEDCATITGIAIHRHGETAGIGDRIEQPAWQASWAGLRVSAPDGRVLLAPRGSAGLRGATEAAYAFDAISGATVTVASVGRMARYWLGEQGFGPFLARCRAGEVDWP